MAWELKDYAALYAATLSSVTAYWQIRSAVRDRARLSVSVRRQGRKLSASITNVGRRPITVDRLRVRYQPQGSPSCHLDAQPQERFVHPSGNVTYVDRPRELRETQPLVVDLDLPEATFSARLLSVAVLDSTGQGWTPTARNLRQLRADLAGVSREEVKKLFPPPK